jgi:hypothetical protein
MKHFKVERNNTERAGQLASEKHRFGEFGRYAVAAVHSRFGKVEFFVFDAEQVDEVTGGPAVIRQAQSLGLALHGLEARQ